MSEGQGQRAHGEKQPEIFGKLYAGFREDCRF